MIYYSCMRFAKIIVFKYATHKILRCRMFGDFLDVGTAPPPRPQENYSFLDSLMNNLSSVFLKILLFLIVLATIILAFFYLLKYAVQKCVNVAEEIMYAIFVVVLYSL